MTVEAARARGSLNGFGGVAITGAPSSSSDEDSRSSIAFGCVCMVSKKDVAEGGPGVVDWTATTEVVLAEGAVRDE